jgi:glycosyltransferase involved in cell wall biosynthesis
MDNKKIRVFHTTEGVSWAGMEAYLYSLLPRLAQSGNIEVTFASFHDGPLINRLKKKGVKALVLQRRRKFDFFIFFRLIKLLRKINPDIIHMHGYLSIFYGIPAALVNRTPIKVVTLHASPIPSGQTKILSKLMLYLGIAYQMLKISKTYLIAVSKDIYDSHKKVRNINPFCMEVIHNGIDIEEIRTHEPTLKRYDIGINESDFLIGIIGRIDKNKGHIYLIKAAKKLISEGKSIKVVIIGEGALQNDLKAYCTLNQLGRNIHFLGFKKNIIDFLYLIDVLVISSLHEGIPYILLEAMAIGVPVIATDVGGIPEVIKDNLNGLLVPSKDSEAIASRIHLLMEDATIRDRLSKSALEILNQRFSQKVMTQSTINVYNKLLLSDE